MSTYKNTENNYNNVYNYIKNRQDLYSKVFNQLAYNLLFSEHILSLDELDALSALVSLDALTLRYEFLTEIEKFVLQRVIRTSIQSEKDNSFVEFIATANNIYINTNNCDCEKTTIGELYMYCIEDEDNSHKDIIILTEKHVIKHIGIVNNNTINWNDKFSICEGIYMNFDVPDNDTINAVTSKIILIGLK